MSELELKKDNLSEEDILKAQNKAKEASVFLVNKTVKRMRDIQTDSRNVHGKNSKSFVRGSWLVVKNDYDTKLKSGDSLKVHYRDMAKFRAPEDELMFKNLSERDLVVGLKHNKSVISENKAYHKVENEYDQQKDDLSFHEEISHGDTRVVRNVSVPGAYSSPERSGEVVKVEQSTYRDGELVGSRIWVSDPEKITSLQEAKEAEVARRIAGQIIDRTLQTEKASRSHKKDRDTTVIDRRVKRANQIAYAKIMSAKSKR